MKYLFYLLLLISSIGPINLFSQECNECNIIGEWEKITSYWDEGGRQYTLDFFNFEDDSTGIIMNIIEGSYSGLLWESSYPQYEIKEDCGIILNDSDSRFEFSPVSFSYSIIDSQNDCSEVTLAIGEEDTIRIKIISREFVLIADPNLRHTYLYSNGGDTSGCVNSSETECPPTETDNSFNDNGATVGVLSKTDEAFEGYTFFSPFASTKAFMVDNCGNLINEWDRGTLPGLSAYFLDNGLVLRTYKVDPVGPFTSPSNAGGLELVDWDNNLVWQYVINTDTQLTHHDAVYMPNGNILTLIWELTFRDDLIALGRDSNEIAFENFMWSEKILELEPIGSDSANIIWEWHVNDHMIQDFDSTKSNFGVVSDNPELYDINLHSLESGSYLDWFHFNAIDYNPTLDQILISTRNSNELWIIDHSTTTLEAAGHTGGTYGKGGDILYRWGNPSSYQASSISEQKFFGQHGTNWIPEGQMDAGSILVFNNGNGKPGENCSLVQVLSPPQTEPGFYTRDADLPYGPPDALTIYGDSPDENFYSRFQSNAFRLPNGNTLINSGSPGRIFEITEDRDIAWEYEIPLNRDIPTPQGEFIGNNSNFRAYKYALDFSGFDNLDIVPGPPIEANPLTCELSTSTDDPLENAINLRYLHTSNSIQIDDHDQRTQSLIVYDMQGRQLEAHTLSSASTIVLHNNYPLGYYVVNLITVKGEMMSRKLLMY